MNPGWFLEGLIVESIGIVVEVILIVVILQYVRDSRRKRLLQPAIQRALLRIRRDTLSLDSEFKAVFTGARDETATQVLVAEVNDLEVRLDQLIVSSHDLLGTRMMRRLIEIHRIVGAIAYLIDSEISQLAREDRTTAVHRFIIDDGRARLERLLEKLTSSLHLLAIQ